MTSRPRQWHIPLLLGVALVIVNTWPLLPRLDRIGRADAPDGQYALWQATWVARAIVTDPLHVYDANIFFPHRATLAFSEPSLLAGIMGVPAYVATKSPYATHNLAVLGYFLLSFVSAFALGRYVTGERLPAIACGKPATMPAKMIIEMPLPMPRSVICSPSHMRNIVPVVRVRTVTRRNTRPGSTTRPGWDSRAIEIPSAWKSDSTTVP